MKPSKRNPLIIANWKMNCTVHETLRLLTELKGYLSGKQESEVVVAPDFVSLHPACIALTEEKIRVAAQDMYWEENGAFTGEVSASMLAEVGCTFVILGHSERRQNFHETDEWVRKKVQAALHADLIPIVCVGETLLEREKNQTQATVERQLQAIFHGAEMLHGTDFVVAYEPIWAIGTGKQATPEQAQEIHGLIRKQIALLFRGDVAEQVRIIYGGSVTPQNMSGLMKMPDVDGVLVGGASLDARTFAQIVEYQETDDRESE